MDVPRLRARGGIGNRPAIGELEAVKSSRRRLGGRALEPSVGAAFHVYRGASLAQDEPYPLLRRRPEPKPHAAIRHDRRSEGHVVREAIPHHEPEPG